MIGAGFPLGAPVLHVISMFMGIARDDRSGAPDRRAEIWDNRPLRHLARADSSTSSTRGRIWWICRRGPARRCNRRHNCHPIRPLVTRTLCSLALQGPPPQATAAPLPVSPPALPTALPNTDAALKQADEETKVAKQECRNKLTSGELKTYMAVVDYSNPQIVAAYKAAGYR
jgi:hypothetical protein